MAYTVTGLNRTAPCTCPVRRPDLTLLDIQSSDNLTVLRDSHHVVSLIKCPISKSCQLYCTLSRNRMTVIQSFRSVIRGPVHNHGHCRPLTLLAGRDALQFEGLFATRAALRGTEQLRVTYGQSPGTPARADLDLLHA